MKNMLIFSVLCIPFSALAAEPYTSCPVGYIAVNKNMIVKGESCPAGYIYFGNIDAVNCTATSSEAMCVVYIPSNTNYTDSTGTYDFTSLCNID